MSSTQSHIENLVFLSLERWDEVWRRNQFICKLLLERNPNLRILWVNPPVDAFFNPSWVSFLNDSAAPAAECSRFWTLNLVKPFPNLIGRWFNELVFKQKIESALDELKFHQPRVWINDQNMAPVVRRLQLSPLIYDITDDWSAASLNGRQRATVISNDSWLVENAKNVIVCSPHLQELKRSAKALHLIPNGVESARYHPAELAGLNKPNDLSALKGPIVGYTGTLHQDRLDVELLKHIAVELPDTNLVFVGPNCLAAHHQEELLKLENIKLLGPRPYSELPSYLAHFDVCFVPHKVNAFTDSLDPLKLYEYFATGKPVVSTPCAGFRDFPKLIGLASTASELVQAISNALKKPESADIVEEKLSFARNNDWKQRIAQIENLLGLDSYKQYSVQ